MHNEVAQKRVSIVLDNELKDEVTQLAKSQGLTFSGFVRMMLIKQVGKNK